MQLQITNLVYNQLIDESRLEKVPTLPSTMQTGARLTDFDLTDSNWSIIEHDCLPTMVHWSRLLVALRVGS